MDPLEQKKYGFVPWSLFPLVLGGSIAGWLNSLRTVGRPTLRAKSSMGKCESGENTRVSYGLFHSLRGLEPD
jgi:hypothetical protein